MGGNILNKNILAIGIIILFIVSTLTPIAIGYKIVNINKELIDNINLGEQLQHNSISLDLTGMGPKNTPWPMKCHDNRHTGRSLYSTVHIDGTEKWRFPLYHRATNDPIIDSDGTIYISCDLDHLLAINPDGTEKWKIDLGGQIIGSTAAIGEDGTIYVGSWSDFLHAVNPDGTFKWKFYAYDTIASSPSIADDGTIFFGTMGTGHQIFAVNPDGTEKWRYPTGYYITSSPAIGDDGAVYIGSGDNFLYALYPNGDLRWRFETGHYVKGPPSIADDGTIYICSWDDYLYAINPNGTLKWRLAVGTGSETNPSIASDGTIYVGGNDLWAVNPDGTMKWTFNPGEDRSIHQSSPTISADGAIYVGVNIGDYGGEIVVVSSNGVEKWRKRIGNYECQSTPCIAEDGTVYIGSSSRSSTGTYGYLHAFGPLDPNAPLAPTINGPTTGRAGIVYDYTFVTTDPLGKDVYYWVEWGDGFFSDWLGPYPSGWEMSYDYAYDETGSYTISCRAKNTDELWGPEGTHSVTMPRNKYSNILLLQIFNRFQVRLPLLTRLLSLGGCDII